LEHWLKAHELKKDHPLEYWRYLEWLIPHIPDPAEEHLAVEQEIWLDTPSGLPLLSELDTPEGIPLKGFIDLGQWGLEIPRIGDLKTTTNIRYAKTPAELNQDTQLNTYARWVFGVQKELDVIEVGHWYLKVEGPGKKPPKRIKSEKVLPVFTEITREGNDAVWKRDCATMEQMKIVSLTEKWKDTEPNINHCSAYGGCKFKEKCGISARDTMFQKPNKGRDMSFLDKIKSAEIKNAEKSNAKAEKEAPKEVKAAPEEKKEPKKSSFLSNLGKKPVEVKTVSEPKDSAIRPPDAAPPTPSTEESEAIRNEAKEKLEAKEGKKAATKKAPAKKATRKHKHKRELTLYIGCAVMKGEDQAFTLVDDWIAPAIEELNAALKETGQSDYRLLEYSEEKTALEEAVMSKVREGDMPRALVCTDNDIGRAVAAILHPVATDIVRAFR
jgi:hypothetical protein